MPDSKAAYLALAMVLVLGLCLSLLFFTGPFYAFDDQSYIAYAHQMLNGTFRLAESPYAYGFLVPLSIAASFSVFGANVAASALPSITEYLIIILLAFAIAKKAYGRGYGLVSAFLAATAPFIVGYSTRVLPDMAVGMVAGISILFFVYAQGKRNSELFYSLSGAFAALTVYVKLVGLAYLAFFVIAVMLYGFIKPKQKPRTMPQYAFLYSLAGVAVIVLLYAAIFQAYGNGVLVALGTYGQNQNSISPTTLGKNAVAMLVMLIGTFGYINPNNLFAPFMDPQVFPLGLMVLFSACGTLIGLIKRDMRLVFLSVLLWGVFFYLFFGTVTLTRYSFMAVVSRYFILVSVPIAVLAAYSVCGVSNFLSSCFRIRSVYFVTLFLLAIMLLDIPIYNTLYNYNISISGDARTFSGMLNYLAKNQSSKINISISDNYSATNFLRFLLGYNKSSDIRIIPTDFSNRANITAWVNKECRPGMGNAYFALVYSNYSEAQYETIFQNWIMKYCNLTEVRAFQDVPSSNGIYANDVNVDIKLYKIG